MAKQTPIEAFHDEFVANMPPAAHSGTYAAAAHDAFHGRTFKGLDGIDCHGEWAFRFERGRFLEAVRRDRGGLVARPSVDGDKDSVA